MVVFDLEEQKVAACAGARGAAGAEDVVATYAIAGDRPLISTRPL
jgi:hypothetical protein